MTSNIIPALMVMGCVFTLFIFFDRYVAMRKARANLRGRIGLDGNADSLLQEHELFIASREPTGLAAILWHFMYGIGVVNTNVLRDMEKQFYRAGILSPNSPIYLLFYKRLGSLGVIALAAIFFLMGDHGLGKSMNLLLAFILGIIGIFGAKLYIQNAITKRKNMLMQGFPDTLDLLLVCVESGLALDASLNRVCSELGRAYPGITEELNRTRLELTLLNDRPRALMNLAERTDLVAFRSLVAALIQSERFGTSLIDTLRVLSEEYRMQRLYVAEAKAAKLPVYMTIPLICCLLPAIFIVVLGPAIIAFNKSGGLGG
jgi:tight adherence protein C